MNWVEIVSLVLNVLFFGGGIVMLVTLRATKRKADAEAKSVELENDEKVSRQMRDYIVKPLKSEINALRKDVRSLQKAIEKVGDCPYADTCPVKRELQNNQDSERNDSENGSGNADGCTIDKNGNEGGNVIDKFD